MLVDDHGAPIAIATEFLTYVSLRGCSPNTVLAYAYDLAHLWRFFAVAGVSWDQLIPARAPELLAYLRSLQSSRRGSATGPVLATSGGEPSKTLSPRTVNRALAAVSAFYDWAILCSRLDGVNPILRVAERSAMMASVGTDPFSRALPGARFRPRLCGSGPHGACRGPSTRGRSGSFCCNSATGAIWPSCA